MWDMEWEFGDVGKWGHWGDLGALEGFGDMAIWDEISGCGRDLGTWGFGGVKEIWGHREMWAWGQNLGTVGRFGGV